eukprot:scaffold283_cov110-Isochrysis_galbana.AAC.1
MEKPPSGVRSRLARRPSASTTIRLLPEGVSSAVRRQPAGCGDLLGGLPGLPGLPHNIGLTTAAVLPMPVRARNSGLI